MIAAFAAVYIIWGSTYLAIRFAIETIPPFMMAGARFLISGLVLYLWALSRGTAARPGRLQWRNTAIVGACLLVGGNGAVVWAEGMVPSGLTALLVAILPFWIVLIDWIRPHGRRPSMGVAIGLVVGLAGLVVLIGPAALHPGAQTASGDGVKLIGAVVLIFGSLSWALGSIFSQHATLPRSAILATGMEMICGGALLLLTSVLFKEPTHFDLAGVSARSIGGFLYLTTIGSLVGFTAFVWLLSHQPPSRVSTYAYVNPVVAVFLGWALAGEALSLRTAIAAAIIIGAVAIITTARSSSPLPERA